MLRILLCLLLISQPVFADEIADATSAYNQGKYQRAYELALPLAEAGCPEGLILMGRILENGVLGADPDPAGAATYYQKAVDAGSVEAILLLASAYKSGSGVPKDLKKAQTLLLQAAERGNAEAQYNIALLLSQTQKEIAFDWAMKAAIQGHAGAELFVGACYEFGAGTEKDRSCAEEWYRKAEKKGLSRSESIFAKRQ